MANTNTKINMPPLLSPNCDIVVSGQRNDVVKAVSEINNIYKTLEQKCKSINVSVPREKHRLVIGPRRRGLDEIFEQTKVAVEPPTDPDSDEFTLRGCAADLGRALTMIFQKASRSTTEEVTAPQWLHKLLIGRKGNALASIKKGCEAVSLNDLVPIIMAFGTMFFFLGSCRLSNQWG